MMKNRNMLKLVLGFMLPAVAVISGCAPQSGGARQATPPAAVRAGYDSFLYADATSVQLLFWTETSGGALTGETDELQTLRPGSPTFLTSDLAWTGTRRGRQIIVTLPGATILATLEGSSLVRQVPDPGTGTIVTERWVAGTRADYNTLVQAFRDYVALGQDLQAISFELQTAQQFPNLFTPERVQSYLADAQNQLVALQALRIPHLPGLLLPWIIPPRDIAMTIAAAERFLGTPQPGTGQ